MRTGVARWRAGLAGVVLLAAATSVTFVVLVPPYESPDEHAHVEYVRQVALHGLPREIPPFGAPERRFVYEWVQPPLYYVLAAPLALAAGASAPTILTPDPSSRLLGGPRWVVYSHERPLDPPELARRLYLLRAFGVLLAALCVIATVLLTRAVSGSDRASLLAGAALALVPQWTAIMSSAANDGLATTLSAWAVLALWPLVAVQTAGWAVTAGLLAGLALSTKLTAACVIPGLLYALWSTQTTRRVQLGAAALAALAMAGGWPFAWNLVAHGDLLASAFKRAALEAGGFTGAAGSVPGPFDPGFWRYVVVMVVEPFWARFGSLGAGLAAGSRGWGVYFALTACVALAIVSGSVASWTAEKRRGPAERSRRQLAQALTVTVACGLLLWLGANVVNPSAMVVHWTPRHVMPLTASLVALGALGAVRAAAWLPRSARHLLGWPLLAVLAGLWLIVVRDVAAAFR